VDIDYRTVLAIVGLVALTVLLTGPGMWSEKWGWWIFRDRSRKPGPPPGPDDDGTGSDLRRKSG
jgi:hypothetical protein